MTTSFTRYLRALVIFLSFSAVFSSAGRGQQKVNDDVATVEGMVCDSQNRAIEDANVSLEGADHEHKFVTRSDPQGHYRFAAVPSGSYTVRASKQGYSEKSDIPFRVSRPGVKLSVLHLANAVSPATLKDALSLPEYSDEPMFIVAGVTDPSNLGGHGSDTALRTREDLAKDAASLSHEGAGSANANPRNAGDAAEVHARLGDVAESEGRPLEAVREYQRAAQLEPSEEHVFVWGAELLLHRAFEPAIEIFARGHKDFPTSVRMLVGLGVATYDQGATAQGEQFLLQACEPEPSDFTPYLFLGRLLEAEKAELPGWTEKLQQFVSVHPGNALAHYYFAVALAKRSTAGEDSAAVEFELKNAIARDPRLGKAYLQLGILYSVQKKIPEAISELQNAVENTPLADEAHYRLAQLYRQSGKMENARHEMTLYRESSQLRTRDAEQKRHEIQQFVYTLRGPGATSPATDTKPQ